HNILSYSTNAAISNCKFKGDYVGERATGTRITNSKLIGENAFRDSLDIVVEGSETSASFGRKSRSLVYKNSVSKGKHSLSHIKHLKVINSELKEHASLCSSSDIMAFSPYIYCVRNPRSGIIVAGRITYVDMNPDIFDPPDVKIFAVGVDSIKKYKGFDRPEIVKINQSDIDGEWTSDNLEERMAHICRKHGVEHPRFGQLAAAD
ncbi:MAG: DUF3737 family protein, partial [Candidatus Aenigmarchaeota archaeon]|nr:DUF3737 family protein [Candidatus Aenigmarchaeota archaeon]